MSSYIIGPRAESNPTVGVTINGRYAPTLTVGRVFAPAADVLLALQHSNFADDMMLVDENGTPMPVVSLDFQNGAYSINGVSKTLAEVCETDLNWHTFDPAGVIPGQGLTATQLSSSQGFVLTPAAFAAAGVAFSGAINYIFTGPASLDFELMDLPGYNHVIDCYADSSVSGGNRVTDYLYTTPYPYTPATVGLEHKVAFTFATTDASVSYDGEAIRAFGAAPDNTSGSTDIGLSCAAAPGGVSAVIKSLKIYPVLTNTQLITLSTL